MKKWLVDTAVSSKLYYLKNDQGFYHSVYDAIVFSKIKQLLGGNVRFMVTGSAPIAAEVLDFLKIAFCCPMLEGYGLTESSASGVITNPDDAVSGHVGGLTQNFKLKLKDLPALQA